MAPLKQGHTSSLSSSPSPIAIADRFSSFFSSCPELSCLQSEGKASSSTSSLLLFALECTEVPLMIVQHSEILFTSSSLLKLLPLPVLEYLTREDQPCECSCSGCPVNLEESEGLSCTVAERTKFLHHVTHACAQRRPSSFSLPFGRTRSLDISISPFKHAYCARFSEIRTSEEELENYKCAAKVETDTEWALIAFDTLARQCKALASSESIPETCGCRFDDFEKQQMQQIVELAHAKDSDTCQSIFTRERPKIYLSRSWRCHSQPDRAFQQNLSYLGWDLKSKREIFFWNSREISQELKELYKLEEEKDEAAKRTQQLELLEHIFEASPSPMGAFLLFDDYSDGHCILLNPIGATIVCPNASPRTRYSKTMFSGQPKDFHATWVTKCKEAKATKKPVVWEQFWGTIGRHQLVSLMWVRDNIWTWYMQDVHTLKTKAEILERHKEILEGS